tara:strand:+ start:4273 stop:5109 length:837 start_codon:yes stop_codon:yes gene_type:complete
METQILISIPVYKESENILKLINEITEYCPQADILIINDLSNDSTPEIIEKINNKKIKYIERPFKMGLGTAHKLSMLFAIKNHYNYLITMDGDFSHEPKEIPNLIEDIKPGQFIIGSRFCLNGKSDYQGIRKIVSNLGNIVARTFLNIKLKELTTYYRVYEVNSLKKLPFNELNAEGYSLGVRVIWLLNKLKINLIEKPIHFKVRNKGKSKIPKFQIFVSIYDLIIMKFKDIFLNQKFYFGDNNTYNFILKCENCNNSLLTLVKKKKFKCLVCGKNNS